MSEKTWWAKHVFSPKRYYSKKWSGNIIRMPNWKRDFLFGIKIVRIFNWCLWACIVVYFLKVFNLNNNVIDLILEYYVMMRDILWDNDAIEFNSICLNILWKWIRGIIVKNVYLIWTLKMVTIYSLLEGVIFYRDYTGNNSFIIEDYTKMFFFIVRGFLCDSP